MDVINEITPKEVNGNEGIVGDGTRLKVYSHWNVSSWVVIEINGMRLTVNSIELMRAIENARNWKGS